MKREFYCLVYTSQWITKKNSVHCLVCMFVYWFWMSKPNILFEHSWALSIKLDFISDTSYMYATHPMSIDFNFQFKRTHIRHKYVKKRWIHISYYPNHCRSSAWFYIEFSTMFILSSNRILFTAQFPIPFSLPPFLVSFILRSPFYLYLYLYSIAPISNI